MDDLNSGLASTSNESAAESTPTPDAVLDAAFASAPEGAAPSEPSGSSDPVTEPVAATAQPQAPTTPETQPKGEPPPERWDSILANARTKARDEALAEHRDALEIVNKLRTDFSGTLAQLLDEAVGDDRFSEAITAKAAALLNARKQRGKVDSEPDADLQTADGSLVYSAEQLRKWHEWNNRQMERKLSEQFKPLADLQQNVQRAQQHQAEQRKALTIAEQRGALWKTMPMFEENKAAILERQQAIYKDMRTAGRQDDMDAPWEAMQRAYAEVIQSQALPKLHAKQTETLVASAQHKRAGSTADPAAAAPAQMRRPRTPDEALNQVFDAVLGV